MNRSPKLKQLLWVQWPTGRYAILPPDADGRCPCYAIKPTGRKGYALWFLGVATPPVNLGRFDVITAAKDHADMLIGRWPD